MGTFLLFLVVVVTMGLLRGQSLDRARERRDRELAKRREPRLTEGVPATHVASPPPVGSSSQVMVAGTSAGEWLDEGTARAPDPGEPLMEAGARPPARAPRMEVTVDHAGQTRNARASAPRRS